MYIQQRRVNKISCKWIIIRLTGTSQQHKSEDKRMVSSKFCEKTNIDPPELTFKVREKNDNFG